VIQLETVEFNHDPTDPTRSALNIRRNAKGTIPRPEWKRGKSTSPEDAPAAYSIASTDGQAVTVRATLRNTDAVPASVEIRATGGGPLGALDTVRIDLHGGAEASVDMPLTHRQFGGIAVQDMTWEWQVRTVGGTGPWNDLATTRHRIYTVLAVPGAPWSPDLNNPANPWTSLLDHACNTCLGVDDAESATRAIVQELYSDYRLKYDIYKGKPRYWRSPEFLLTAWIERVLDGKRSDDPYAPDCPRERYWDDWIVNCTDCAVAVTLMSGIIGAPTRCVEQNPFGYINLLRLIGRPPANNPFYACGGDPIVGPTQKRTQFDFHTYATMHGAYYDACIRAVPSGLLKLAVWFLWVAAFMVTAGRMRWRWLEDRAEGWLTELPSAFYFPIVLAASPTGSDPQPGPPKAQTIYLL